MRQLHNLEMQLDVPWQGQTFHTPELGLLNFLVGPNGSGKSKFAEQLLKHIPAKLLSTDRLQSMGAKQGLGFLGEYFAEGIPKNHFENIKNAGQRLGDGLDAFIVLSEQHKVRIKIEATLGGLFDRDIHLEWDSGNLIPKIRSRKTGAQYRADKDECHGLMELVVILTHLYNEKCNYLIIDEPELNLHPQYQSFLMEEIRKTAGLSDGLNGKKLIFLITHSPIFVDIQSIDDLKSIIMFKTDYSVPSTLKNLTPKEEESLIDLIPFINTNVKQIFFSDSPIFVEGISDQNVLEAIQKRRGFSISSAGSCIISAGGSEFVNKCVELCQALDKRAFFLYDLDSLFSGNLKQCIGNDGQVKEFLATVGIGADFVKYCNELDTKLDQAINSFMNCDDIAIKATQLAEYLQNVERNIEKNKFAKKRLAFLLTISEDRPLLEKALSKIDITEIEDRLNKIIEALAAKKIFLLKKGALEHYLPSYEGNRFTLKEASKKKAVIKEINLLATGKHDSELAKRYSDLFTCITKLPAKGQVDYSETLSRYLAQYILDLQLAATTNHSWRHIELMMYLEKTQNNIGSLFGLHSFERKSDKEFIAVIQINFDGLHYATVDHTTNAGLQNVILTDLPPIVGDCKIFCVKE